MATASEPNFTPEQWMEIAWSKNPPDLSDSTRKLLETYSKVPAAEVDEHVTKIREKGFNIWPYPCIGQWRFLHLAIGQHPRYQEVLQRMLTGKQVLLDLGCAFAQDIRRLVADGVDSSKCYGADMRLQFLDLGYELFRDKETLQSGFIEGDIFVDDNALTSLHGKVDIINASSFFHLFARDEQKKIAHRCLKFWTGEPGNLLVGRQVGNLESGSHKTRAGGMMVFRHSPDSWQAMWDEISAESGVKFKVQSVLVDMQGYTDIGSKIFGNAEGTKLIVFSVERV